MYRNSIYFGLKVVPIQVLWGPKYILFGNMDPYISIPYRTLIDPLKEPLWFGT